MPSAWPLFLFLTLPFCIYAGQENTSTGARSAGLADASVCLDDIWSSHNNQAGLAILRTPGAAFACQIPFLVKELKRAALVIALPVHGGTIGLDVTSFGFSLYTENKCGLSFARAFGKNFSAGVQMDYLSTQIAEGYGNSARLAAEAGIQARILKGLVFAAHIYNPTRSPISASTSERIPTTLRMGLSYTSSPKVMVYLEAEKDSWHNPIFKTALEYNPRPELSLRAGVSNNPSLMSFGFGLLSPHFRLDLASSWNPILGYTPTVGIAYRIRNKTTQD